MPLYKRQILNARNRSANTTQSSTSSLRPSPANSANLGGASSSKAASPSNQNEQNSQASKPQLARRGRGLTQRSNAATPLSPPRQEIVQSDLEEDLEMENQRDMDCEPNPVSRLEDDELEHEEALGNGNTDSLAKFTPLNVSKPMSPKKSVPLPKVKTTSSKVSAPTGSARKLGSGNARPKRTFDRRSSSSSPQPEMRRKRPDMRQKQSVGRSLEVQAGSFAFEVSSESDPEESDLRPPRAPMSEDIIATSSSSFDISEDRHDSHWIKFLKYVEEHPDTAYNQLAVDLIEAGPSSPAILGSLIRRSFDKNVIPELREKYTLTILHGILAITMRQDNNNDDVADLINMIFIDLRHFSTDVLYSVVEHCVNYMKNTDRDGYLPPRWIEIFGKMVSILVGRGNIKHETDIIDGTAYKKYVVNEIVRPEWNTENTASFIAIYRSMPDLDDEDINTVLQRANSVMKNFKAAAFPPVIHQLILLVGSNCTYELLSLCSEYFSNVKFTDTASLEVRQKRNALGTVVFHFLEAARTSNAMLKAAVKIIKASNFNFGMVMNPFVLSIVLGLTTYEHCHSAIIDPLRNSIVKAFHSNHLCKMSQWYNRTSGDIQDMVTQTFKVILESNPNGSSEIEFMFAGLRELGVGLLNAEHLQTKYPNTLEQCQKLGSYLILSVVKFSTEQLKISINQLLKKSSKSIANMECLAACLETRTRQIISPGVIGRTCEIIRYLPMMDSVSAAILVKGLAKALQLNYTLLDALMVILRKAVWKSVEARRTAAKIMIMLLSNSKMSGDVPFSQYSESQRYYDDFLSPKPEQLPDNQPLCFEILSLTKRCFNQQKEIREELYLGFHSVVRKNPALCELICTQIFKHAKQYVNEEDLNEPKLSLNSIIELSTSNFNPVIIKEEFGFLVQCIAFAVVQSYRAFRSIEGGTPAIVKDLEKLARTIIEIFSRMDTTYVERMAEETVQDAGGSHPLEVRLRYVETVFAYQMMQTIEALIEFLNCGSEERDGQIVKTLFTLYKSIREALSKKEKAPKQKGKGDKKGAKDKTQNVLDDDALSNASGSQSGVRFKRPDAPKKLVYYHIMNLESVLNMLQNLYKHDPDKGVLNRVNQDVEFERLLLTIARTKLKSFIRKEPLHERSRHPEKVLDVFAGIAGAIWNGLLTHGHDDAEVEVTDLMVLKVEVVKEITSHLCSLQSPVVVQLVKIFGDMEGEEVSYDDAFIKFLNSWKAVHKWIPFTADSDLCATIHQGLFDILTAFSKPLTPGGEFTLKVSNWMWNYIASSSGKPANPDFQLAESACECWLAYFMKGKTFLEQPGESQHDVLAIAKAVYQQFGIDQDIATQHGTQFYADPTAPKLWILNEETASNILCAIMFHVESQLNSVSALLGKLKFHPMDNEEALKKANEMRESCFNMITQILHVCSKLIISNFPAGLSSTTMLKTIPQIFDILSGFAEYFMEISKTKINYSIKGFAGPVNYMSKEFQGKVEEMIQHIEKVQRCQAEVALAQAADKKSKGRNLLPSTIRNQYTQEKKLIPNVIFSIEKYDQQILVLSKALEKKGKKGIFLRIGMKMSSLRDFRIDHGKLIEGLQRNRARSVAEMSTVPDATTQLDQTATAGPSRPRVRTVNPKRARKGRKRKPSETEELNESGEQE